MESGTYGLEWNTTVKGIIRMLRSSDSEESDNLDIVTTVIDSGEPAVIANGNDDVIAQTTHNASPACITYSLYGQTYTTLDGDLIWRATLNEKESGRLFINNALALVNATISGAGTGDVEVIDANTLYLNVDGTRLAKVDFAAGSISAATIVYNAVIDDNVSVGPVSTDNGKLYLSVYNPSRQLWQPFLQLDSSGVLTLGFPIIQKDT
jgi:outer membrane protein assembly factor BamB